MASRKIDMHPVVQSLIATILGMAALQAHIRVLETMPENKTTLLLGLEYLIGISYVDDTEVFKDPLISGIVDGLGSPIHQLRQLYAGPMLKLRMLMICRIAKLEDVLIIEDENGSTVRETLK